MTYYKVKAQYDNNVRYKERPDYRLRSDGILVANELYTPAERAKIMNGSWVFEKVEIPKSKIYFFFGARFAEV